MEMDNKKKLGLLIPGGLFIGLGIGFAADNIPAGLFIGLGVGMITYSIFLFFGK